MSLDEISNMRNGNKADPDEMDTEWQTCSSCFDSSNEYPKLFLWRTEDNYHRRAVVGSWRQNVYKYWLTAYRTKPAKEKCT